MGATRDSLLLAAFASAVVVLPFEMQTMDYRQRLAQRTGLVLPCSGAGPAVISAGGGLGGLCRGRLWAQVRSGVTTVRDVGG